MIKMLGWVDTMAGGNGSGFQREREESKNQFIWSNWLDL